MELTSIFGQLGIALGLGLLVGLQRESVASPLAGVRTFPLVTIFGSVCGLLSQSFGGWIVAMGMVSLAGMIFAGKTIETKSEKADPGLTTEAAILLMFAVGAYLIVGHRAAAIAIGGGVAVLLHLKGQLHGAVAKLGETDLKAIMQFALISLVILPVLPNRPYGPYQILNPRNIWWMVVLIVGISLGGYIAYKFFGERIGTLTGGILGGMISSTATTVSLSRRSASMPESIASATVVILIASTMLFGRLQLEIAAVAPVFLQTAAPPLSIMLLLMAALSLGQWLLSRSEPSEMPEQDNPSELKSALLFGLIYAVVLFFVEAAKERFGNHGLYVVAGLSGLTDMDAITLSISQLVNAGRVSAEQGWKLIVVAAISNLLFKTAAVAVLAHRRLFARIALVFGIAMAAGVILLIFWR